LLSDKYFGHWLLAIGNREAANSQWPKAKQNDESTNKNSLKEEKAVFTEHQ
jgi:hypothetical protein